nr:ShlB/FhaC/HecB family hemolysin secretion/activation protein [uncultured Cohaesibacter sp.]
MSDRVMKYSSLLVFGFGLACAGISQSAQAQTAGQLVRNSYAPSVVRSVPGGLQLMASTAHEAPEGAELLSVTPSDLEVEGGLATMQKATSEIAASIKGKRVTGAELFAKAHELEVAYARAGYLLVRVSIPPQTVRNGAPFKLSVINGRVSSIDTSAVPEKVRERVRSLLEPLVGKTSLSRRELERRLLLAGDTSGVRLKSALKAGDVFGSTSIVVEAKYSPVRVISSVNNSLSDEMGTYSVDLGVDFNSLFGLGEVAYLRLGGYPGGENGSVFDEYPRNRQAVVGVTVPLGTDGWWVNAEAVDSRTHPTSDLGYTMLDHYQKLTGSVGYHWVRGRQFNTSSLLTFEMASEKQTIDVAGAKSAFSEDQLRIIRFGQSASLYDPWGGLFSASAVASFGLDALGARQGTTALPLSRDGAEPDFSKLAVDVNYKKAALQNRINFSFAAAAQTSFGEALVSSEQLTLSGRDWLSAFDAGDIVGDSGVVARGEVSYPVTMPLLSGLEGVQTVVSPYLHAEAGAAKLEQATALENKWTRAYSVGAGLRLALGKMDSNIATSLVLEYAHGEATGLDEKDRFNFALTSQF